MKSGRKILTKIILPTMVAFAMACSSDQPGEDQPEKKDVKKKENILQKETKSDSTRSVALSPRAKAAISDYIFRGLDTLDIVQDWRQFKYDSTSLEIYYEVRGGFVHNGATDHLKFDIDKMPQPLRDTLIEKYEYHDFFMGDNGFYGLLDQYGQDSCLTLHYFVDGDLTDKQTIELAPTDFTPDMMSYSASMLRFHQAFPNSHAYQSYINLLRRNGFQETAVDYERGRRFEAIDDSLSWSVQHRKALAAEIVLNELDMAGMLRKGNKVTFYKNGLHIDYGHDGTHVINDTTAIDGLWFYFDHGQLIKDSYDTRNNLQDRIENYIKDNAKEYFRHQDLSLDDQRLYQLAQKIHTNYINMTCDFGCDELDAVRSNDGEKDGYIHVLGTFKQPQTDISNILHFKNQAPFDSVFSKKHKKTLEKPGL